MEIENFKIIATSNSQYRKLLEMTGNGTTDYSPFINSKKIYLYFSGYLHYISFGKEEYDKLNYEELTFQEFKNKYFLNKERTKKLKRLNDLSN